MPKACRNQDGRSRQCVAEGPLHSRAQRGVCDHGRTARHGIPCRPPRGLARGAVRDRRPYRRQRQYDRMERPAAAVAAEPAQAPLRQGRGTGSRISRRHRKRIPRTASIGDICRRRTADQPRHARAWQRARSRQGQALPGAQVRVLDGSSARCRRDSAGRDAETGFKSNKETDPEG